MASKPTGLVSCQLQSQVSGKVRHAPKYSLRRQLALEDPDVAGDPALADDRVVAARRRARVRYDVERDPVSVRPVVEAEVHAFEQFCGALGHLRDGVRHDLQAGGQPAVVDGRQERAVERFTRRGPDRELRAVAVVVPVVELAALLVPLHSFERRNRLRQALDRLAVADDPEPLGDDRAPHIRADVRRRRLDAPRAVELQAVGRQAGVLIGHGNEAGPRVGGVAKERFTLGRVQPAGRASEASGTVSERTVASATTKARARAAGRRGISRPPGFAGLVNAVFGLRQPFRPVVAMPSVIQRCISTKTISTGTTRITEPAMSIP